MQMNNMKYATMLTAALIVVAAGGVSLGAQAEDANAPKTAWDQFWDGFHNPAPWLQMGADFRFRIEYGENWQTLSDDAHRVDHQWNYERYRTRWWTKSILSEDVSINTRLTWETRTWNEPSGKLQRADLAATDPRNYPVREWNPDEAIIDWLNINVRNIGDLPLAATVGRQDLLGFGAGWLIMDGTPLDGSRTMYFDAARFTYGGKDTENVLDLIYVDQSAQSDRWLNPINDQERAVAIQDERAAIAYLTNKSLAPTQLEGFFIYKNDNPIDFFTVNRTPVTNIPWSSASPAFTAWSRKAEIFTVGGGVSNIVAPEDHWKYRAEGAYQTGDRDDRSGVSQDVEAYGALTNLEYLFRDPLQNAVHIGYEFDSGDNPNTNDDEQFDLLWGKWPRWSELLIYTASNETDVADLTNLHRANIGHRIQLTKECSLSTDYHLLWADKFGQPWKTGASGINVSGDSHFRGQLVTSWLRYQFSKQLVGHLMGEYFIPGSYYEKSTGENADNAFFVRLNVEYTF
jgi:hypothetical protein